MNGQLHIIGAGLAGLSAALTATARAVTVYEAGPAAGGRVLKVENYLRVCKCVQTAT